MWMIELLVMTALASILQAPPEPSVELPPGLARVLSDYEVAWSARDATALAALFAEDGFVLPNGRPPVRGREAIRQYYGGYAPRRESRTRESSP